MAIETDFIFELWEAMKPLVPSKDKLEAAERIIKMCDDYGISKTDLEDMIENDKILETAFDRYFVDDYDEDEDDDSWDDYDE
jgi:hypothetical protein